MHIRNIDMSATLITEEIRTHVLNIHGKKTSVALQLTNICVLFFSHLKSLQNGVIILNFKHPVQITFRSK